MVPTALSFRKVAEQASEYFTAAGYPPRRVGGWLRKRAVAAAGGVLASIGGFAAGVLKVRQHTRSGCPTERLYPAPPTP